MLKKAPLFSHYAITRNISTWLYSTTASILFCFRIKSIYKNFIISIAQIAQYFILVLVLIIAGCGATKSVKNSPNSPSSTNEAIVFGSIQVVGSFSKEYSSNAYVLLANLSTSSGVTLQRTKDLSSPNAAIAFTWKLPAGQYSIIQYEEGYSSRPHGRQLIHVDARFTIQKSQPTMYLGRLIIKIIGKKATMQIDDAIDQDFEWLKKTFPNIEGEVSKKLMIIHRKR
ncbi:hypothetical protein [Marinobacterium aestuariivivens]|uniref:Carboxypeptidase regulatory-like domain-containing protein n=1 Tax=Marinobacterium aestuariivivens TaxID=1698799 RepID=A0ABW2A4I8_9GAMM